MSYRPITDTWIMARAKLKHGEKYYGAYLGGFPERARALLGVTLADPVLHVCSGKAQHYPYARGFGPNDKTLDLDPTNKPDFVHDARQPLPLRKAGFRTIRNAKAKVDCEDCYAPSGRVCVKHSTEDYMEPWPAILADPPYTEEDAAFYKPGSESFPKPNLLLKNCIDAVRVGGRVGMIGYIWPSPPKNALSVAAIGVLCGFNNRIRIYAVYERIS